MVGQVGILKRLSELRNQLDETCKELGAKEYVKDALSDFLHITQAMNEIKVLKRKRTDLKIRIKNLERELDSGSPRPSGSLNLSRASNTSFTKFLDNVEDDTSELLNGAHECTDYDYEEIDFVDEYFDPEEEKSPHFRPYPEYVPSNSLPHSQRRFRHEKRVGLLRDLNSEPRGLNTGLVDFTGQFRSVEDEEVDWYKMCTNDSKTYTLRKNRRNGYHHARDPQIIVIKPKVENIVKNRKKSIVQVLRKLSDYGLEESRKDCICKREPCNIVCSGKDCDYSFTGRLAASCDQHPGDNYLMDHSPRCPRCKGKLVERNMVKDDVFNDSKPIIVNPSLVTSTPREKKAKSKKIHLEYAAQDQAILAT